MKAALLFLCLGVAFSQDDAPDWLIIDEKATETNHQESSEEPARFGWNQQETQLETDEVPLASRSILPSLEAWSNSPHLLKQEIRSVFKAKNYPKVIELIDILLAHEKGQAEVLYKKAFALRQLGKFEDSLRVYDEVLEVKPKFRDAWYDRGGVLARLGKLEDALQSYDQAIGLNGNLTWLHYDRAVLLKKMQKWTEALQGFKRSVELGPKNSWAQLELGNMYFSINQYVHAMKYYQAALELNPKLPDAQKNLKFCIRYLEGK